MTFKFTTTTTPAHLEVPDSARAKASERYLYWNLIQMKAKLDTYGKPFAGGADLKDTGALQASGQSSAKGYGFAVKYAEAVDARHHFAGLAPQFQQKAEQEISAIWDSEPLEIVDD